MSNPLSALLSIFPYDPKMDTPLGHRNLILIYVVVWAAQLGYAIYAIGKYRASMKK